MSEDKVKYFLKTTEDTVLASSLKAVKHLNVFSLQRADNLGVSVWGCETSKDLQLFKEDEQVVSKATKNSAIQQQEQEQVLREFQIFRTILSKPVTVILQVG